METYEDDDDTHFCIKCHLTINGLENYVRHRQSGCRAPEAKQSEITSETPSTPTTVTYPEILNADAFFSSLELQSSAKSNLPLRSRSLVDKERKAGRNEDRVKKKPRRGQETDDSGLKEKLLNMPPVVADLDDLMDHLGIPSLVGFPDIVSATAGKSSNPTSGKCTSTPSSTKLNNHDNLSASPVESIIASSKGCNDRKRHEDSQRMEQDHSEWLDDTILVDMDTNSENKEGDHGELTGYVDYDYQQDEESDEDSHDDDIDDIESYSNDDEIEEREYPPRGLTGGKWKPSEILNDMGRLNEDEFLENEDNPEPPPPLGTGGKWKPADSSNGQGKEENDSAGKNPGGSSLGPSVTTERRPPPGHTRGKWIPGAPGDFGPGYWCDPCGRKLASRLLYNRHLLSDLHARRSIQEIDGDLQLPRGVGPLLRRKPASKRQRALAKIKSRSKILSQEEVIVTGEKSRRRQKEVLSCEMCQARVRRPQMGKHLLSHYHCRVAGTNPYSNPAARRFILENMSNVVRQCPFQCSICRFYCNTEATFLRHWRSKLHASKFDDEDGTYKCTPCDFYCDENNTMEQHLTGSSHREVVAMMNGSVPVVVGRQRYLVCETCNQRFRYNLQLRFHARKTGHRVNVTATDEYQSKITCGQCSQVVKSRVALQRHQLSCHERKEVVKVKDEMVEIVVRSSAPYFCSFCMMNFTTAQDAILHRRTSSHKAMVKTQKLTAEHLASLARDCPHCESRQATLLEHKDHLLQQHPELCHRCPRCGSLFALPQDVTRHTRDKECAKLTDEYDDRLCSQDGNWRCTNCSFVTDSQAEFLFHDALHVGSIETETEEAGCSRIPAKYRCPLCDKSFCKVTLRNHIRAHTGERPFRCANCTQSFTRRSSLNLHRKECLASSLATWRKQNEADSRNRNHACPECNAAFFTNQYATRWVSYRETYKKRTWGIFVKTATRINYRREGYIQWTNVEQCCDGYEMLSASPLTCRPVCTSGCPHGRCVSPDICTCSSGYRYKTIDASNLCFPICNGHTEDFEGCGFHAKCVAPDQCECHTGYRHTQSMHVINGIKVVPCIPECDPECGKNAYCHGPNDCRCNNGYRSTSQSPDGSIMECVPICEEGCINGVCVSPDTCICHLGYKQDPSKSASCEPVCDDYCINADCIEPNNCQCHQGFEKNLKDRPELCSPVCDPSCINGNCTEPNHCECYQGYQKNSSDRIEFCSPICDPPCINGICGRPGECECHEGYEKNLQSASHICKPICENPCINADCTRPNHCECHHGYLMNLQGSTEVCSPICDPSCINGTCIGPDVCECLDGYGKDPKGPPNMCSPVCDPPCVNADCTRPNHCECHHRYEMHPEVSTRVCSPICDPPCVNGRCARPDNCECMNGFGKKPGQEPQVCSPICDPACVNSDCTLPNHCECHQGHLKNPPGGLHRCLPVCDVPCINGFCHGPNQCKCHDGYKNNPKEPPQRCSPVCQPNCGLNAHCESPNNCVCNVGYIMTTVATSALMASDRVAIISTRKSPFQNSSVCVPSCEPECNKNASCIAPNVCQCKPGYSSVFSSDQPSNPTRCLPICEKDCANGFCGYPNKCICHLGYELSLTDAFACQPFCQYDCINANCTRPNYCECHDGYEKAQSSRTEQHAKLFITDNLCIPSCLEECPSGGCFRSNQCESQADQKNNELDLSGVPNITEDCPKDGNFLEANGTCICKDGWSGIECTEPTFCIVTFAADNETEERSGILSSGFIEHDPMKETDYDKATHGYWLTRACSEECRNTLYFSESPGNFSEKIIRCYRLPVFKIINDLVSTDDQSSVTEDRNQTIVCFVRAESECRISETQISTFHERMYRAHGVIGISLVVAAVGVVSLVIYIAYEKRRKTKVTSAASMSDSIITEWPDDPDHTYGTITESSSLHALKQHIMRHAGKNYKCGLPGCPTILRTENELRSHRLLVHETGSFDRHFRCNNCPYAAKTRTQLRRHQTRHETRNANENSGQLSCPHSHCNFTTKLTSHLRRHIRLHTGTKPYKCRHCSYASNNLENLRKHVLSTSLHPGKSIYECGVCNENDGAVPYCTNFAKELRAHLLEAHPRDFPRPSDASDHVAKIFRNDEEPASPTPDASSPYEDSITGQEQDHEYKCARISPSTESKLTTVT